MLKICYNSNTLLTGGTMSLYETYVKDYQKTAKGRWSRQKANARARGISWELTFEEWLEIWNTSGKWEERGNKADNYCMARKFDIGPYSKDNVEIIKGKRNSQESYQRSLVFFTPKNRIKKPLQIMQKPIIDHWETSTKLAKEWGPSKIYRDLPLDSNENISNIVDN